MPFIDPTGEQIKAFAELGLEGPIVMLNLLRYKPDGGREQYAQYGAHAVQEVLKRGGKILFQTEARATVIGDEQWDTMILVEYPSVAAFLEMIGSKDYQSHVHHRTESLLDSRLICTQFAE